MRIIVGSASKHKLSAVSEACEKLGIAADISGEKIKITANEQPIRLEQTYKYAVARAAATSVKFGGGDPDIVCIGIESGVMPVGSLDFSEYIDLAVVIVLAGARRIVSTSSGISFPQDCFLEANRRGFSEVTVGSIIAEKLGCDAADPHSALTHGKVSRKDTLVQALMIALSQL